MRECYFEDMSIYTADILTGILRLSLALALTYARHAGARICRLQLALPVEIKMSVISEYQASIITLKARRPHRPPVSILHLSLISSASDIFKEVERQLAEARPD